MRRLDRGAGAAPLRARANAARALGEPRDPALRPLGAVREELAGRRNASSALRSQARPGVGGNGQGAARRNAAMERRVASTLPLKRVAPGAIRFAQTAQACLRRRRRRKSAARRSIPLIHVRGLLTMPRACAPREYMRTRATQNRRQTLRLQSGALATIQREVPCTAKSLGLP
jgi:hypothetical protein